MRIGHDPGHGYAIRGGGTHPGTDLGGVTEREWVLTQAREIVAAVPWCEHMLLHDERDSIPYGNRARIAADEGCDLAILHHVNAGPTSDLDGLMTFVIAGDHIAREVAAAIMRAAPAELRRRKARPTPASPTDWTADAHGVLRHYREAGVRAVLIEWGFATSPTDREELLSNATLPARCVAAAAGIARAFELLHES